MIYHILVYTIALFILFLVGVGVYNKIILIPNSSHRGAPPPLTKNQIALQENLHAHVYQLATQIGERNMGHFQALEQAADYVEAQFQSFGLKVSRHTYELKGKAVSNIIAEIEGRVRPEEIVVIGAHYDSVRNSPGANDNGSGVAALLELSRLMGKAKPDRTLRFIAFVNEEPPYFMTKNMGSYQYARLASLKKEQIKAMLSLETIGYYSSTPKSQRYPFPFMFFYPNTGNFIGFVGRLSDKDLVRKSISAFRKNTKFPSEGAVGPGWLPGISWSDQWSFWKFNYPAMMITDTAPFRYPYYHSPQDTPDKLDYESMAQVTDGLHDVVLNLVTLEPEKNN